MVLTIVLADTLAKCVDSGLNGNLIGMTVIHGVVINVVAIVVRCYINGVF